MTQDKAVLRRVRVLVTKARENIAQMSTSHPSEEGRKADVHKDLTDALKLLIEVLENG